MGKHIMDYGTLLRKNGISLKRQFGSHLKNNNNPSDIVKKFEEVKNKIDKNTEVNNHD
jgi:hypothetical protein